MATIEEYKKAVLARYEEEKNGEFSEFLLHPTPAKLKKMSVLLLDGLNATDKNIFDIFFDHENVTLKHIEGFDNDRFRPLCNYITGKSNLSRVQGIDLIAVFVRLNSRPFNKFRNAKTFIEENKFEQHIPEDAEGIFIDDNFTEANSLTVIHPETKSPLSENSSNENKRQIVLSLKPKVLQLSLLSLILTASIIGIFNNMFEEKGCMVWKNDHYEEVDCDMESTQSFFASSVIPLDKETCKYLKKVQVSDTTTFFNKEGSPRIWYYKCPDKKIEYYTYPGVHPETGKALKDITHYMVDKYVMNKKQ